MRLTRLSLMLILLSSLASAAQKLDTPEKTCEAWRKGILAPFGSPEQTALAECYSFNMGSSIRFEPYVAQYIDANKLEFAAAKVTGDKADVILKNDTGKTLTIRMKKEGDNWRVCRLPDFRPLYLRLLDWRVLLPVCLLLLVITLWIRKRAVQAAKAGAED